MITVVRDLIYRAVAAGPPTLDDEPVQVYRWLPLSAEEVPCLAVGRPRLIEGDITSIANTTTPVFALGRTTRDDDAQVELDKLADLLVAALWSPWSSEGVSLKLTSVEPTTLDVGGTVFPAYTAVVAAECRIC